MDERAKYAGLIIAVYGYFVGVIGLAIFEIGPLGLFTMLVMLGMVGYFFYLLTVGSQQSIETNAVSKFAKSWPRRIFRGALLTFSAVFGFLLFVMIAVGEDTIGVELITDLLGTTSLAEQMTEFNRRIRLLIGVLAVYLPMKFVHNFDQGIWSMLDNCVQYLTDEEEATEEVREVGADEEVEEMREVEEQTT